jgi:hypothetical protein
MARTSPTERRRLKAVEVFTFLAGLAHEDSSHVRPETQELIGYHILDTFSILTQTHLHGVDAEMERNQQAGTYNPDNTMPAAAGK